MIERTCGPVAYTRAAEAAFRSMWRKYCETPGEISGIPAIGQDGDIR
jgi:hypothetical protein